MPEVNRGNKRGQHLFYESHQITLLPAQTEGFRVETKQVKQSFYTELVGGSNPSPCTILDTALTSKELKDVHTGHKITASDEKPRSKAGRC